MVFLEMRRRKGISRHFRQMTSRREMTEYHTCARYLSGHSAKKESESIMKLFRLTMAFLFSLCLAGAAFSGEEISSETAMEMALAQTGGGTVMNMGRHYRGNGVHIYRMEILAPDGAYHVELDAADGGVVKLIRKGGKRRFPASQPPASGTGVNFDKALEIALAQTGGGAVVESDVDVKRDGRVIYEFEIVNNGIKSEVEIDSDGRIVEFKQKKKRHAVVLPAETASSTPAAPAVSPPLPQLRLSAEAAQALAREKSGGGAVTEYELDWDDGRPVHEIVVRDGNARHEMTIDDETGAVVEYSRK